jgi:hypothetical protein
MAEMSDVQQSVERAVAQVLSDQFPKMQAELVQQVLQALPAQRSGSSDAGSSEKVLRALAGVHAGSTQKEILRALLEGGGAHCSRLALFVVKAGAATGWQGRGFADEESIKDFSLDMNAGPVAHAYRNRVVAPANVAEMGNRFIEQFGGPANEQVLILPLLLKEKVAALLYADGGADGLLDAAALELLVMGTSAWLEVISLRKQSQKEGGGSAERIAPAAPAPVQTVSSFSDPFAGHAPKHVAAPASEPAADVVEVAAAAPAASGVGAAPAAASDPFAGLSPEDADTHRKAQRFARLLVDEIKLYNQAKVAEGRRHKDLYDRLREDIEKSRATYQKRYGNTAAASGDYFQQELVRSLAEDDLAVMGANFRR